MPKSHDIDGIIVNVVNPHLGQGGQGYAEQVALASDPAVGLVAKHIPMSKKAKKRIKYLVDQNLALLSPGLAGPIAANISGKNEIMHLAPLAIGHDPLSDNCTFPENFERAYLLMCLFCILEENGIAHGDIAPSNIIISKDGDVYLIDFDNFATHDPDIPSPQMAGQHMMMAPEIRSGDGNVTPNIESDRFAYGVILNMLLLRRHPVRDAQVPTDVDLAMSSGHWPERDYPHQTGDVPQEALGEELPRLFDAAFSLDPTHRPSADDWRRALGRALHNMVIHDCGEAFVHFPNQQSCPWCNASIAGQLKPHVTQLKLNIPVMGARYSIDLEDRKPIILGRNNLGGHATVSGQHLEITPMGDRLFLRHIGRNPTQMLKDGKWHKLESYWLDLADISQTPVTLKVADLHVDLGL